MKLTYSQHDAMVHTHAEFHHGHSHAEVSHHAGGHHLLQVQKFIGILLDLPLQIQNLHNDVLCFVDVPVRAARHVTHGRGCLYR